MLRSHIHLFKNYRRIILHKQRKILKLKTKKKNKLINRKLQKKNQKGFIIPLE